MLKVTRESFDDLSEEEKENASNNGFGKECASYIRVEYNDKTILLESDAIEPEDTTFYRDLSWIVSAIEYAYKLGKEENNPAMIP